MADVERYTTEGRRLLEVLDKRLEGHDYIMQDFGYSIADIAAWYMRNNAYTIPG